MLVDEQQKHNKVRERTQQSARKNKTKTVVLT
jgi:hypothetical protein